MEKALKAALIVILLAILAVPIYLTLYYVSVMLLSK